MPNHIRKMNNPQLVLKTTFFFSKKEKKKRIRKEEIPWKISEAAEAGKKNINYDRSSER